MATWTEPKYTRSQVEKAGKILVQETVAQSDLSWAMEVLDNWRACHSFPMNTFQVRLRANARKVCGPTSVVAQRLKRTPSIIAKLQRAPEDQKMSLKRMQDIAGCRAIVPVVSNVFDLQRHYCEEVTHLHELVTLKDYISTPKADGYRSVHMVYKFKSEQNSHFNNQLVEIQIRSQLQHCWATALESVDIMNQSGLKLGIGGNKDWKRFFQLMSAVFAIEEDIGELGVAGSEREIKQEAAELAIELDVAARLVNFGRLFQLPVKLSAAAYYLMVLDPVKKELTVRTFLKQHISLATRLYTETEERYQRVVGAQVVLVSAGHVAALKRAYPSYYMDTAMFIHKLESLKK